MLDWAKVRLEIAVNNSCNASCPHCFASARKGRGASMTGDQVVSVLSDFARMGGERVSFSGGEPTLVMQALLSGILFAHTHGLVTGMTTNSWWGKARTVNGYLGGNMAGTKGAKAWAN